MKAVSVTKYGFRIKTRQGMVVDNLMIHALDEPEAQRKLRQMYLGCEILECVCHLGAGNASVTYESVLDRISH